MPKGIYIRTDKTRQVLSDAHLGKKLSLEHVKKIASANRGKHRTEESRLRMSQAPRRKYGPLTPEHRAKISASSKGRSVSLETRQRISEALIIHPGDTKLDRVLRKTYGITEEDYNILALKQDNKCAICSEMETGTRRGIAIKRLSVDHDHISGKVRGLLCNRCNKALGGFNDSAILLSNAINYLNKGTI